MALVDEIKQMQQQGMSNDEIIRTFQEQGISPMEINEAFASSQIRAAISGENMPEGIGEGMQPSISQEPEVPQEQYPVYDQYQGYSQAPSYSSPEMMNEVASQVIEEKISSLRKKIAETTAIKSEIDTKLEIMEKRVKKIEEVIDKLESAILQKIGDYSKGITEIKSELGMMQESFSKVLPRAVEKVREKSSSKKK